MTQHWKTWIARGIPLLLLFCCILGGGVSQGEEQPSLEELIAQDLQEQLHGEKVSVVLKGTSPYGGGYRAREMFCYIRGALLEGLRYDSITIYVESLAFRVENQRVVLRYFQKGKVSGTLLLEDIKKGLQEVYPALSIETITSVPQAFVIKGVYVRKTTIPLKAQIMLKGVYLPQESGKGKLHFIDSSSNNPFISTRDIALALEKVAPELSLRSFFPSQKIRDIRIAGENLWFFSDYQQRQKDL